MIGQLEKEGYAQLGVVEPNLPTEAVAKKIGEIIKIPGLAIVQRLVPKAKDTVPENVYSGNYGLEDFPLHTDLAHWYLPPRYFILRCISPVPTVYTTVVQPQVALGGLSQSTIKRAMFQPRRLLDNKLCLLRLIQDALIRWDQLFLVAKNAEAEEVSHHIKHRQPDFQTTKIGFVEPGETLLIDNWKVLHGRTAVPESGYTRVIDRVYLSEIWNGYQ